MRASRQIASRMREMLIQDKFGVKEGFSTMFSNDINRVMRDYFDLQENVKVEVSQTQDGNFCVQIKALAKNIKQFDTTKDMKRF